jgi:preprotein translocase subunit SecE
VAKQTAARPARSKAPAAASTTGAAGSGPVTRGSALGFFQASWAELKKVTWPTRQETMNLTVAVIAMTVAVAIFLGVIDTTLDQVVKLFIPH